MSWLNCLVKVSHEETDLSEKAGELLFVKTFTFTLARHHTVRTVSAPSSFIAWILWPHRQRAGDLLPLPSVHISDLAAPSY